MRLTTAVHFVKRWIRWYIEDFKDDYRQLIKGEKVDA